eukprot:546198-Pleurochrysis_carterae.AAC.2
MGGGKRYGRGGGRASESQSSFASATRRSWRMSTQTSKPWARRLQGHEHADFKTMENYSLTAPPQRPAGQCRDVLRLQPVGEAPPRRTSDWAYQSERWTRDNVDATARHDVEGEKWQSKRWWPVGGAGATCASVCASTWCWHRKRRRIKSVYTSDGRELRRMGC